jgi:uncharacterized protein (TIGR02265 family)
MQLVRARDGYERGENIGVGLRPYLRAIENTPHSARISGMYVAGLYESFAGRGIDIAPPEPIKSFRYYSLREFMELLLDGAVTLHPDLPVSSGLQMLGRLVIPTFASSLGGKVIMGVVGHDWELALTCVARGYQVSLRPGSASIGNLSKGRAVVELRQVYNFGDSYQVGVIEGLMEWCLVEGRVTPTVRSAASTDLLVEWTYH